MASTWVTWSDSAATSYYYVDSTGCGDTWRSWNQTTTASTSNDTWYTWSTAPTSSGGTATTTDTYTWDEWCETDRYVVVERSDDGYAVWSQRLDGLVKSRQRDRVAELYRNNQLQINRIWNDILAEELKQIKKEAELKAQDLLLDLVGEKEFEMYKRTGKLLVKGRKNTYILGKGRIAIVEGKDITEKGKVKGMCVHLNYDDYKKCPETDNVIALKLNIEHKEKELLKTANHHGLRNPDRDEEEFLKVVNG
jgi:hypothetical protein